MNITRKVWLALFTCALSWLAANSVVFGKQIVKGQYTTSKYPYWQVGGASKKLSIACRNGKFKQNRYLYYSIGYIGKKGRGITGIAKKGWNLYDPQGLAKPEYTYHFFNQGYSNCKVYVAETPRR